MEETTGQQSQQVDTGMFCLVNIFAYYGKYLDPVKTKHDFAIQEKVNTLKFLSIAKKNDFKAKNLKVNYKKLQKLRYPLVMEDKENNYFILAKKENDQFLILNASEGTKIVSKQDLLHIWNGNIILLVPRKSQVFDREFNLKWFIPTVLKYKRQFFEVMLSSFVIQIFGVIVPMITQVVIDKVLVHNSMTTLEVMSIALILLAFFESFMSIAKGYVFNNMTNKIDVILGAKLFKHLFELPLAYYESRRLGDTIARVKELENIRRFLTGAPLSTILDVLFIVVYVVVMLFYSVPLTLLVLGTLPLFIILSLVVTPMFKSRLDEQFKYGAENQSFLVESISGVQTVKSFALESSRQSQWESNLASYVKSTFKTSILSSNANAISQFISKATDIAILWYGATLVIQNRMSIGQLIAFRMLSGRVSGPVLRMVGVWQELQQTGLSIRRLGDILNARPENTNTGNKSRMPAIRGEIIFEKVRFRYRPEAAEVIRNMSFRIKPGLVIGVVGRSGSGKSTLSKLIQRLYVPEAGRILIDGNDIALADPVWLRRQIGVVLQESFLFSGSVRDNIAISKPSASMEEIVHFAKMAGAHEFILELTEGYDTMIGEKGVGLSGGQKQRIAIARALLNNPRILIFDEATSALDYESERIIQNNLNEICKGRTVMIIAHRLSTLRNANYIMSMNNGDLVEFGTQEELLSKKGLYHYLHSQQEAR